MVLAGGFLMPCLCGGCRRVTLMRRSFFGSGWTSGCSAGPAVVADAVSRSFVDYGLFVGVVKAAHIHVIHRAVVAEGSVIPISALIADATITEAIVDAAVEADRGAPVARIPG